MTELYVKVNDIEKMHYKRKSKLALVLEFDLGYLPVENSNTKGKDPLELIVMNQQTGEIVAQDVLPLAKIPEHCQVVFWEVLRTLPMRVMKIQVSKQMKSMLLPLEALLEIELVESNLPTIEEYRDFTKAHHLLDE